jgi:hypothetical protein
MISEVVLSEEANSTLCDHLLQHFRTAQTQEDLCFALWRLSTGTVRRTALVDVVLLPIDGDRVLHGNASFTSEYLGRATRLACEQGMGLAFLHSHPTPGWQGMSQPDVLAERDVIAYPAMATGLPLIGLTVGTDGYWSARFWEPRNGTMDRQWCHKVRVIGHHTYKLYFHDKIFPPPARKPILRRTFDTWGTDAQNSIARLHVGIIGLGSVGCLVAEAMGRMGVGQLTLVDPDRVEEHNLDRLLYGTSMNVGKLKVQVAERALRKHSTARNIRINTVPLSVHDEVAYRAALDCDIIFSCVDRPVARDVLNYIANAHLIPVIDGGIAIETKAGSGRLLSAHWRAHLVTPYHSCLRCNGQYNTSMVVMELDGSLDDPSYVRNLPNGGEIGNQNVFPFSMSAAALEINLMLRYMLAEDWWPLVKQQDCQFVTADTRINNDSCLPTCAFRTRRAAGNSQTPHYIRGSMSMSPARRCSLAVAQAIKVVGRVFGIFGR